MEERSRGALTAPKDSVNTTSSGVRPQGTLRAFFWEFVPKSVICLRGYNRRALIRDLIAGLTVGVIALPLALAFAIASGVGPERGLYTAIVAGFLISALGGSRVQIGGPTGAFVVIVSGIVTRYGYEGLVVCTLMAGVLVIIMGLARFGGMIRFIPFPVVTGFTSGIAVVIFSSQIKDLLGLRMGAVPPEFFEKWEAYWHNLGTLNAAAAAVGIGTAGFVFIQRRLAPRVPGMIVAMAGATVLVQFLNLPVETIGSRFGELPSGLPAPRLPSIGLDQVRELVVPAFTVALLAAIESLLSATVADGMMGTRHRSNTELVAQGVANIASSIFGGIPATGAIARTATNVKSGARTPVAGMIHAVTLLVIMLLAAPLAKLIPLACLAGILVVVSWQMSEIEHFRRLLRSPRSDVAVLLLTFVLTVVVDLTVAVQVGVVLAALLFIRRMSEITNVGAITREMEDRPEDASDSQEPSLPGVPPGVEIYQIRGPFFFGAAETFQDAMRSVRRPPEVMILQMKDVSAVDATGLHVLREFHKRCVRDGTRLILSGLHAQPLAALLRSGMDREIGEENLAGDLDAAIASACG